MIDRFVYSLYPSLERREGYFFQN